MKLLFVCARSVSLAAAGTEAAAGNPMQRTVTRRASFCARLAKQWPFENASINAWTVTNASRHRKTLFLLLHNNGHGSLRFTRQETKPTGKWFCRKQNRPLLTRNVFRPKCSCRNENATGIESRCEFTNAKKIPSSTLE